jgi:hypothetical protein
MTCIYILKLNNNNIGYYFNYDEGRDFLYSCYYANFIKDTDNVVIETFKQNTNIKIDSETIYFTVTNNTNNTNNNTINNKNNDNDLESFSNSSKTTISTDNNIFSDIESDTESELNVDYISTESESSIKSKKSVESVESTFSEFMKKREDNKKKTKLMNDIGQEKIDITYHINLLKQEKKKIQEKENEYNYDLELYEKFKKLKETNNNFKIPELFITKYNIFSKLEETDQISFDNFIFLYQPEVVSTDYDSMFSAPSHFKSANNNNEELDQTYETLNKKYDEIVRNNKLEEISKLCETFVDESYDNLFMVSHNLSSKPEDTLNIVSEVEPEPKLETKLETELKTELEPDLETKLESELKTELEPKLEPELEPIESNKPLKNNELTVEYIEKLRASRYNL